MRSCTAETIYAEAGYSVKSAGTSKSATVPLTDEIINWADLIFAMEEKHRVIITNYFPEASMGKRIIVLNVPDNYYYMEDELVELLKERIKPYLS